jgi:hypothetical protein
MKLNGSRAVLVTEIATILFKADLSEIFAFLDFIWQLKFYTVIRQLIMRL